MFTVDMDFDTGEVVFFRVLIGLSMAGHDCKANLVCVCSLRFVWSQIFFFSGLNSQLDSKVSADTVIVLKGFFCAIDMIGFILPPGGETHIRSF